MTMLAEKDTDLERHSQTIQSHESTIQGHESTIQSREHYIALLEERLRLVNAQQFSTSSEKQAFQIDLFDEAELEQAIADLHDQLPDNLLPKSACVDKKKRQRGFSDSLTRV